MNRTHVQTFSTRTASLNLPSVYMRWQSLFVDNRHSLSVDNQYSSDAPTLGRFLNYTHILLLDFMYCHLPWLLSIVVPQPTLLQHLQTTLHPSAWFYVLYFYNTCNDNPWLLSVIVPYSTLLQHLRIMRYSSVWFGVLYFHYTCNATVNLKD